MKFNKHVQIREEKFGTVIFETLKEKVFVTNGTGAEIVRLIQENKTTDEIVNELTKDYGVEATTAATEVNEFIDNLVRNEVLLKQACC